FEGDFSVLEARVADLDRLGVPTESGHRAGELFSLELEGDADGEFARAELDRPFPRAFDPGLAPRFPRVGLRFAGPVGLDRAMDEVAFALAGVMGGDRFPMLPPDHVEIDCIAVHDTVGDGHFGSGTNPGGAGHGLAFLLQLNPRVDLGAVRHGELPVPTACEGG